MAVHCRICGSVLEPWDDFEGQRCAAPLACGERARIDDLRRQALAGAEEVKVVVSLEMVRAGVEGGMSPALAAAFAAIWGAAAVAVREGIPPEKWARYTEIAMAAAAAPPERLAQALDLLRRIERGSDEAD